jgi:hypothetical protein
LQGLIQDTKPQHQNLHSNLCIYYGSPLAAGSSNSSWGPAKLRQFIQLKKHYNTFTDFATHCVPLGPYSTTSTVLNPCVCMCVYSVYVIVCVHACVYAYVCVASQYPLFRKVFIICFFKYNLTVCISHLMWNRVLCSHGSM